MEPLLYIQTWYSQTGSLQNTHTLDLVRFWLGKANSKNFIPQRQQSTSFIPTGLLISEEFSVKI